MLSGTISVEAQYPVPHDLQRHPGHMRRLAPAPAVQDYRQSQHAPDLVRLTTTPRNRRKSDDV
jgi:hypothetical protein